MFKFGFCVQNHLLNLRFLLQIKNRIVKAIYHHNKPCFATATNNNEYFLRYTHIIYKYHNVCILYIISALYSAGNECDMYKMSSLVTLQTNKLRKGK
jgi:hypothetical protein